LILKYFDFERSSSSLFQKRVVHIKINTIVKRETINGQWCTHYYAENSRNTNITFNRS
jgi:hypothetical protein